MPIKEIAIKIKIDGKEVLLTGKSLESFKKNIVDLKNELKLLEDQGKKNSAEWKSLKGDIDALESSFVEVTDGIDDVGEAIEETTVKTQTYAQQIRELQKELIVLGDRTPENAAKFDELTSSIVELSDRQEDLQFGTQKLDDSLGNIPGPIGQAANAFKQFDGIMKSANSALLNLTRTFPILKSAIAATGIGALVIIVGLLIGAVIKAFNTFKPLQKAVGELGVLFDLLGGFITPIIDLIGNVLTVVLKAFGTTLAFLTGNLKEYNKALADKKATEDFIKASEERLYQAELELIGLKGYARRKKEIEIEYIKAINDIEKKRAEEDEINRKDNIKDSETFQKENIRIFKEYDLSRRQIDKKYYDDSEKSKLEHEKEILDSSRKYFEDTVNLQNEYNTKLIEIEQQRLDNSNKTNKEKLDSQKKIDEDLLEQQYKFNQDTLLLDKERAIDELQQYQQSEDYVKPEYDRRLKLIFDRYNKIEEATKVLYGEKLIAIQTTYNKAVIDANKDLQEKIEDLQDNNLATEQEREIARSKRAEQRTIDDINKTIANETLKEEAIKLVQEKYGKEREEIEKGITTSVNDIFLQSVEFRNQTLRLALEEEFRQAELFGDKTLELGEGKLQIIDALGRREIARTKLISELRIKQADLDRDNELTSLVEQKELLIAVAKETGVELSTIDDDFRAREIEIAKRHATDLRQIAIDSQVAIVQTKVDILNNYSELVSGVVQLLGELGKKSKGLAIAAIVVEKIAAIAQIIANTAIANAKAVAASPLTAGQPWVTINTIAAGLSIAATIAAATNAISSLNKTKEDTKKTTAPQGNNYGRNYEDGGLIKGKRHAAGGTLVEAEDGEAIMTRGAVTLFQPLLSAMNQMGGGTSFNRNALMTSYDAPIINTPSKESVQPMYIKTYIVERELTNQQEKQARLKSLSTI